MVLKLEEQARRKLQLEASHASKGSEPAMCHTEGSNHFTDFPQPPIVVAPRPPIKGSQLFANCHSRKDVKFIILAAFERPRQYEKSVASPT